MCADPFLLSRLLALAAFTLAAPALPAPGKSTVPGLARARWGEGGDEGGRLERHLHLVERVALLQGALGLSFAARHREFNERAGSLLCDRANLVR